MPKTSLLLKSLWWFQLVVALQFSSSVIAIRKDVSLQDNYICRTTVQGRYLIADDKGQVCDALSVDPQSRCCRGKGEQFSCHGCNLLSQCCNSYEFCVACCLNPSRTPKELALKVKIAKPITAGTYSSIFEFCAGRCRHNSESVVHENAYHSEFHHCFSIPSNSSGSSEKPMESRLAGINIIIGRQGESCDLVCKSSGESCVPNKLPLLNQCEMIQKYLGCKGGCLASIGADQPAEVVDDAPVDLFYYIDSLVLLPDVAKNEFWGMLVYYFASCAFLQWLTSAYKTALPMRIVHVRGIILNTSSTSSS